jgi:hypothetical protein
MSIIYATLPSVELCDVDTVLLDVTTHMFLLVGLADFVGLLIEALACCALYRRFALVLVVAVIAAAAARAAKFRSPCRLERILRVLLKLPRNFLYRLFSLSFLRPVSQCQVYTADYRSRRVVESRVRVVVLESEDFFAQRVQANIVVRASGIYPCQSFLDKFLSIDFLHH